ncbi:hypothetical protein IWW39_001980 [Coemansia spiralis]|uniref:AA9 family lytic polysaccharide monooxygenase n=1 Tax=Coemansia spiralis TaxID=417178 RepID=A0A9W8GL22_9FUNG|nr:hypothetical protein IWW39_001980 [Coemansia spiralis]
MKLVLIALVSCLALSVKSATFVKSIGLPDGESSPNALLPHPQYKSMPVIDVQSFDLVCRTPDMNAAVKKPLSVAAGGKVRLTWDAEAKSPYSGSNPYGPCSFWLAPVSSKGKGKVWSKIHEFTFSEGGGAAHWCSTSIVANTYYDVDIPAEIAPGKYYLRSEVIDIDGTRDKSHYLDFTAGARFHVNCAVLDITGMGAAPLKSPISIMESYRPYYKSVLFPSTKKNSEFKMPGGASPYAKAAV